MKHILFLLLALSLFGISSGSAQAPAINQRDLDNLVQEIKSQQTQIRENQEKIDAKMADLTETIRVARLFAGKAGK